MRIAYRPKVEPAPGGTTRRLRDSRGSGLVGQVAACTLVVLTSTGAGPGIAAQDLPANSPSTVTSSPVEPRATRPAPTSPGGSQSPPTSAPWQVDIDPSTAQRLGQRIWANEGASKDRYLMWWNEGENFASLGIGHFIWYPAGTTGPFRESFPALVQYLQKTQAAVPPWLIEASQAGCPWPDREAFFAATSSARFIELAALLRTTVGSQAQFIAQGLGPAYERLIEPAPGRDHALRAEKFQHLAASPEGLYALVDYLNFKGDGMHPSERYSGLGWGLAQVLDAMPAPNPRTKLVAEFVTAARRVLARRVENAPPERNEARWLPGWNARLSTYLEGG